MPKGCLYAWGANSHGQLGLGYQSEQCTLPHLVDLFSSELNEDNIKKIVGGAGHTLILDEKGDVYSCGLNDKGQAARPPDVQIVLNFQRINNLRNVKIKDIACGWNSSMALTEEGEVYVWGSNSHGQLGIDDKIANNYSEPQKLVFHGIKGISMGLRHSALITDLGRVLISGWGNKGQLGILETTNEPIKILRKFEQIPKLQDVKEVACGQNHTVVMTESNEIFAWGDNKFGQLGIGDREKPFAGSPKKVKIDKTGTFSGLHVGWTHTCVSLEDKSVLAWGRNTYGQLGYRENEESNTWLPKSTFLSRKCCQISVGSEHNIAISEERSIYSWGWNEHGNCGDGSTRNVLEPKKIDFFGDNIAAVLVGSGAGHSFAVATTDTLVNIR